MTEITREVRDLIAKISATPLHQRHIYQHRLDHILLCMRVEGKPIPADLARISETLRRDMLEEQFDNMPV